MSELKELNDLNGASKLTQECARKCLETFNEPLSKAVFTTKFVLRDKFPIVYVTHDEDGDWQFFSGHENITDKDIMIVSLGEIIEYDPSINEVSDLPQGKEAFRENQNASWEI